MLAKTDRKAYQFRENRLKTFSEGVRRTSTGDTSVWPHADLSPDHLADCGFYYTPTRTYPDQITCLWCGAKERNLKSVKSISRHHLKRNKRCPYSLITSNLESFVKDSNKETFWERLAAENAPPAVVQPRSAESVALRLSTFKDWHWDSRADTLVTSKNLAEAGFYHAPVNPGDDRVICMYCDCPLADWDPADVPLEEHKKNSFEYCYFLQKEPETSERAAPTPGPEPEINASPPNKRRNSTPIGSPVERKSHELDAFDFSIEELRSDDNGTHDRGTIFQDKSFLPKRLTRAKKQQLAKLRNQEIKSLNSLKMEPEDKLEKQPSDHMSDPASDPAPGPASEQGSNMASDPLSHSSSRIDISHTVDSIHQSVTHETITHESIDDDYTESFSAASSQSQRGQKRQGEENQPAPKKQKSRFSDDDFGLNEADIEKILNSPRKSRKMKTVQKKFTPVPQGIHNISDQNLGDYDAENLSFIENDLNHGMSSPTKLEVLSELRGADNSDKPRGSPITLRPKPFVEIISSPEKHNSSALKVSVFDTSPEKSPENATKSEKIEKLPAETAARKTQKSATPDSSIATPSSPKATMEPTLGESTPVHSPAASSPQSKENDKSQGEPKKKHSQNESNFTSVVETSPEPVVQRSEEPQLSETPGFITDSEEKIQPGTHEGPDNEMALTSEKARENETIEHQRSHVKDTLDTEDSHRNERGSEEDLSQRNFDVSENKHDLQEQSGTTAAANALFFGSSPQKELDPKTTSSPSSAETAKPTKENFEPPSPAKSPTVAESTKTPKLSYAEYVKELKEMETDFVDATVDETREAEQVQTFAKTDEGERSEGVTPEAMGSNIRQDATAVAELKEVSLPDLLDSAKAAGDKSSVQPAETLPSVISNSDVETSQLISMDRFNGEASMEIGDDANELPELDSLHAAAPVSPVTEARPTNQTPKLQEETPAQSSFEDMDNISFDNIESSTPQRTIQVSKKGHHTMQPLSIEFALSQIAALEETINYLSGISASRFELHNDVEGQVTEFIAAMPEEEEEMTIEEWMHHNASTCGKAIREITDNIIGDYVADFDRLIQHVSTLETVD